MPILEGTEKAQSYRASVLSLAYEITIEQAHELKNGITTVVNIEIAERLVADGLAVEKKVEVDNG